jgi:hypothetical protein
MDGWMDGWITLGVFSIYLNMREGSKKTESDAGFSNFNEKHFKCRRCGDGIPEMEIPVKSSLLTGYAFFGRRGTFDHYKSRKLQRTDSSGPLVDNDDV